MAKAKKIEQPNSQFYTRADAEERCLCGQSHKNPKPNHAWFCPEKNKKKKP